MEQSTFMYGDWEALDAPPEPVMTVLLIGFQGATRVLTGTRAALWREFKHGDGGYGCNGIRPIGWEYWCEQPLGTRDHLAVPTNPTIRDALAKKG